MPRKPHPIHSGDFIFEGDVKHYHTHHHLDAGAQHALQTCLHAIKGLGSKGDREALLGRLLATLVEERAIDGLIRLTQLAGLHINHYHAKIEARPY